MSETGTTPTSGPRIEFAEQTPSSLEVSAAIIAAAGLYAIGGALIATAALLPSVRAPGAMVAVAINAFIVAAALYVAFRRERSTLALAFAADLWGVLLVAVLCAESNGASSPFALIYLFAIGHAAAFQPLRRYLIVTLVALLAFLAPLVYEDVSSTFGAVACVGIVLAVLTTGVIHLALNGVREHRRRLKFLIDATATFDTTLDPEQSLRNLARAAVPELAELCVIYLLDRDGSIASTVAAGVDPAVAREVERVRAEQPLDLASAHPVAEVLRTGEPRVVADLTDQAALAEIAESDEHQQFMRDAGYRSAAVFPMVARGRTLGAISFLHIGNDAPYERGVLDVLADLSDRAALAFDNARLYAERSYVAHTLRRSLMPSVLPVIPGLELASFFRPMGAGSEVGGDFYDVFGDETSHWLMVGDVCGKGAEAAALTGFLRHTTVAYAREETSPGKVLSQVNRVMIDQDFEGRFATAILARLCFLEGGEVSVTVASAGHPAALIARACGAAAEFGERGALLGIFPDATIEEASTVLRPGDSLALYTDGLLEAHAPSRTVTAQHLLERLQQRSPALAEDTIDALLGLVELDDQVRDDIAILTARVGTIASGATGQQQHAEALRAARSARLDGRSPDGRDREGEELGRAATR